MGIWGRRAVLVDDDAATLQAIGCLLRDHGAELVSVDHPGAALPTILGVMPDLLLVDMAMTGLDGMGLIRKLRSLPPERGGRIPAATLSPSSTDDDDLAAWSAAGFQRHLVKPIDPAAIVAVMKELGGQSVERRAMALDRRASPRERRSESRPETSPPLQGVAGGDEQLLRELV